MTMTGESSKSVEMLLRDTHAITIDELLALAITKENVVLVFTMF